MTIKTRPFICRHDKTEAYDIERSEGGCLLMHAPCFLSKHEKVEYVKRFLEILALLFGFRQPSYPRAESLEDDVAALRRTAVHRSLWGWRVTTAWVLVALAAAIFGDKSSMPLNAWGDFLAGFTAPLAFLWLVIGYFQQGSELQIQARELNASVKQQAAMAQAAIDAVNIDRARFDDERTRQFETRQPNFNFGAQTIGGGCLANGIQAKIRVRNTGATVYTVDIKSLSREVTITCSRIPEFKSDEYNFFELMFSADLTQFDLQISYEDSDRDHHILEVPVFYENEGLRFERAYRMSGEVSEGR